MGKRKGVSYRKRVEDINRIYDRWAATGVPNIEIWRRYIYPVYGISLRSFYNLLKAIADERGEIDVETRRLLNMGEDDKY